MLQTLFRYFTPRQGREQKGSVSELYPDLKELIALKEMEGHLKLSSGRAIKSTVPGDHHSPFRGQGLEFDSVRQYVPGDDVRTIDWRVTARSGSPHIKLFREEREREVILCVDMNAEMRFGTRNTFKSIQAARAAAFLGWKALEGHDRVGACLFGDIPKGIEYLPPKRTRKSLWGMLQLLSAPSKERHRVDLEKALRHLRQAARTGSLIYVISDFREVTNSLAEIFIELNKNCDVICIAISDPADAFIPPIGGLEFQNDSGERIAANTESLQGREYYKTLWQENRKKFNEAIVRAKISTVELTTEMDIRRDLLLGMRVLSKRRRR